MPPRVSTALLILLACSLQCRSVSDYVSGPTVDDDVVMSVSDIKSQCESWGSIIKGKYENDEKSDGYYEAVELYVQAKAASDKLVDAIVLDLKQNKSARLTDYYGPIKEAQRSSDLFVEHAKSVLREGDEDQYGIPIPSLMVAGELYNWLKGKRDKRKENIIVGFEENARMKPFSEIAF